MTLLLKQNKKASDRYWKNPEKFRDYSLSYYYENLKGNPEYIEKQKVYHAEYRAANREDLCLKKRTDYAENREARLATMKLTAQTPAGRERRNAREKKRRKKRS